MADKYEETLEQLYFATRSLMAHERKEDDALIALDDLRAIINDFIVQVDKIQGERKKEWEMRVNTLKNVFNQVGSIYLNELYWRKKVYKLESDNLNLTSEIERLNKEIEVLKGINEF